MCSFFMKKVLIIGVLGLLLIGCVCFVSYNKLNNVSDEDLPITKIINPATGEKWDSVEKYVYRNVEVKE